MVANDCFLGIDLSTQQIKGVIIDGNGKAVHNVAIGFSTHEKLKKYGTENGVLRNGSEITSPVKMWLESIDLLFDRLKKRNGQREFEEYLDVHNNMVQYTGGQGHKRF
uniref:FGGY_N domain-containing protein n=1 Tax=Caenorhabditis tropicalis TaxID=1561998 RepID=A0A1I7U666_9PELO